MTSNTTVNPSAMVASPTKSADFPNILGGESDANCKYIRIRPLGAGSFAEAWEVRRRGDGALFAAKIMFLRTMDARAQKRAKSEIQCLQTCRHFACMSFVEHFESENRILIIVEYCNAGDLAGFINLCRESGTPFPESTIAVVILQLVLALEHMHRKKILHRDIKSQNVFLSTSGLVKVGDFGLSSEYDTVSGDVANTFCGTPYYLAPEVWRRQRYGVKADIWALGVLSYELITGRCPFTGSDMQSLSRKVLEAPHHPINTARLRVSPELVEMVDLMLTKDPTQRPNAQQLLLFPYFRKQLSSFVPTVENTDRVPPEMKASIAECVAEVEAVLVDVKAKLDENARAMQQNNPNGVYNSIMGMGMSANIDSLAYEGQVKKKKDTKFADRYLVLRGGTLEVLEDSTKPRQRRPLPLTAIKDVCAYEDDYALRCGAGDCFLITTCDNHFYVFAAEDRDVWVRVLNDALQASDLRN